MLQFTIIGNLGADAEVKEINGKKYSSFNVASTKKFGEKDETTWVSVLSFYSEKLHQFLVKGQQVYVSGDGRLNVFTKKDGTISADLSVIASTIQLCGVKNAERQQPPIAQPTSGFDYVQKQQDDSGLPF